MSVDLRGIFFRSFYPDLDDEEEYNPLGPGDISSPDGSVNLSGIKFRAFEEDIEEEE
jgi:hypothetical protein